MQRTQGSSAWTVWVALLLLVLLLGQAAREVAAFASGSGAVLGRFSPKWAAALLAFVGGSALLVGGGAWLALRPGDLEERLLPWIERTGPLRLVTVLAVLAVPPSLLLGPEGWRFTFPWFRVALLVGSGLAAGFLWPARAGALRHRLVLSVLASAALFTAVRPFLKVTDYPFALGWSEGNRLWDYSLYFARDRYEIVGEFRFPTYLTPGRHGLWGLPFLIPGVTIRWLRLWDAVLWTAPYLLLGYVLFGRREGLPGWARWGFTLWAFLFIWQGPIYAPLVLSAALVFAFYDRERLWRTALVTAVACFYAGISRWTWLLAPAAWAALWAFLEMPSGAPLLGRLRQPVVLAAAGLAGALASQAFMALAFPRPDPIYATAASQPLLWYRLFPNATNPMGILRGLALTTGPVLLLLAWARLRRLVAWDLWQLAALAAVLAGTLGAGLVASVKIGGGNNLHNLDMFLVTLVVLAGILADQVLAGGEVRWGDLSPLPQALLALAVLVPVWYTSRVGGPLQLPPEQAVQESLATLKAEVEAAAREGEVLFIDQRQLLTFGQVQVPLVMDYELKHMMNMAMAGNEAYFEAFRRDLARHRFALIVSDPVHIHYQDRDRAFAEENNAWVDHVAIPLLEYYEPVVKLPEVDVWLLAPKGGG